MVILIHYSDLSKKTSVIANLQFDIPNEVLQQSNMREEIENHLSTNCIKVNLSKYAINNKKKEEITIQMASFEFNLKIKNKEKARILVNDLSEMNGIFNIRINFKEDYEKI